MARRKRSRSRGGRNRQSRQSSEQSVADEAGSDAGEELYRLDILPGRHQAPLPTFDVEVEGGKTWPHVCSTAGEGYALRVSNFSQRHIACAVQVDGENALLRDGSLIVAPGDSRELPGYLVSKNFIGKEYVKEYRDFVFGKPRVVEADSSTRGSAIEDQWFSSYGCITCDVYEAVLDEEVDSDQELRGQRTFYRGAGLHGSFDERTVPEGKKTHLVYSSVTLQGSRSSISNSTRGRWWIRGQRLLKRLEVRYRESHSLMLSGIDPKDLGLVQPKCEDDDVKDECKKEEVKCKDELADDSARPPPASLEVCDLTAEDDAV